MNDPRRELATDALMELDDHELDWGRVEYDAQTARRLGIGDESEHRALVLSELRRLLESAERGDLPRDPKRR